MVNNFLNGVNKPYFICEACKQYAPQTIVIIPTSFKAVGISCRNKKPKKVAKTGVNAERGASREIGECLIAQVEEINAIVSRSPAQKRSIKNKGVTFGIPPKKSSIARNIMGRQKSVWKNTRAVG